MELGAFFLVLAVALAVGLLCGPAISRAPRPPPHSRRRRKSPRSWPNATASSTALQELDFDFNLNKIPAEDYPVQRAELLQKGRGDPETTRRPAPLSQREREAAADRIESAVAARRADLSAAQACCPRRR